MHQPALQYTTLLRIMLRSNQFIRTSDLVLQFQQDTGDDRTKVLEHKPQPVWYSNYSRCQELTHLACLLATFAQKMSSKDHISNVGLCLYYAPLAVVYLKLIKLPTRTRLPLSSTNHNNLFVLLVLVKIIRTQCFVIEASGNQLNFHPD
jgi:hypothetical protein